MVFLCLISHRLHILWSLFFHRVQAQCLHYPRVQSVYHYPFKILLNWGFSNGTQLFFFPFLITWFLNSILHDFLCLISHRLHILWSLFFYRVQAQCLHYPRVQSVYHYPFRILLNWGFSNGNQLFFFPFLISYGFWTVFYLIFYV